MTGLMLQQMTWILFLSSSSPAWFLQLTKRALGTRYTPDSLKQLKTGLQNMMTFFMKRKEKVEDLIFFMGLYTAKRNKYAVVPILLTQILFQLVS